MAWKSWLDPFHISGDVTAYVPPLVVLLAGNLNAFIDGLLVGPVHKCKQGVDH